MRQGRYLKRLTVTTAAVACCFIMWSVAGAYAAGTAVFLKFNLHVVGKADRKGNMAFEGSYAGWIEPGADHYIIPINTEVVYEEGGGKFWEKGKGFTFVINDVEKLKSRIGVTVDRVYVEVDTKRVNRSLKDYADLITSPKPVSTDDFNAKDKEGIKAGRAEKGMTKKGILTALGYPSPHETPSLEDSRYTYWRDRFRKLVVVFDGKGTVVDVR